jgi:hypothetical protein
METSAEMPRGITGVTAELRKNFLNSIFACKDTQYFSHLHSRGGIILKLPVNICNIFSMSRRRAFVCVATGLPAWLQPRGELPAKQRKMYNQLIKLPPKNFVS